MKHPITIALLAIAIPALAQDRPLEKTLTSAADTSHGKVTYSYVEQMPSPGFDVVKFLQANVHYPPVAVKKGIQGKVYVKFLVNEDGSISDVTVVRGIGNGCDEEAMRVIKAMPAWRPGKQKGKPVRVSYTQPINFSL